MLSASDFTKICNNTILSNDLCTPQTCCLEQGQLTYIPTVPGNALYAAALGILILPNLWFGIRFKTWSFMTWMVIGLIGELVGYIGRLQLSNNIFDFNAFLTYLIPLTIAPAFITASIYLCLARIIHVVDPALQYTRLKPMTYTKIFVTFDFICLVLQGAGGGMAATADSEAGGRTGANVMIGGMAFQVFSLLLFSAICADFAWRVRRGTIVARAKSGATSTQGEAPLEPTVVEEAHPTTRFDAIRRTRMFRGMMVGLAVATVLILIRSCFRVAELKDGFDGELFNDEVSFMILEGPMMIIACALMTVFHPGLAMRGFWVMKGLGEVLEKTIEKSGESWVAKSMSLVRLRRN